MLLPLVIKYTVVNFKSEKLNGTFEPAVEVEFDWYLWWDGTYSDLKTKWINENFGLRNDLVRFNNQIRFTVFKKSCTSDFIIGKDSYLYQLGYVEQYTGILYQGKKVLEDSVKKIKQLQEELVKHNKHFLIVLAPSKARVYPEYLPDKDQQNKAEESNYSVYKRLFDENGIHYIDVNQWFLQKKDTSTFPLFPKLGVHWSRVEAIRVADSINKYLERLSNSTIPLVQITKLNKLDTLQLPDCDAIKLQNILVYPSYPKMAYPEAQIINANKATYNLMVISDSFWWDIYERQIPWYCYRNNEFWYYNKTAYSNNWLGSKQVEDLDVARHILQNDFVVVVCAESNLNTLGFGFISHALTALSKKITPNEQEIEAYIQQIKSSPDWYNEIKKQALVKHIDEKQSLYENAVYSFKLHGPVIKELGFKDYVERIKNDELWFGVIKQQAKDKKISLDSALIENALYVMKGRNSKREHLQSIDYWMKVIKANTDWFEATKAKANTSGITIEQQLYEEAKYMQSKPVDISKY